MHQDIKTNLNAYAKWTDFVWTTRGHHNKSIAIIMGGLGGEGGEIAAALLNLSAGNKEGYDDLGDYHALERVAEKEFGDWLYYWARLCNELGFEPSNVLEIPNDTQWTGLNWETHAQFDKYNGLLIERLKKYLRDGKEITDVTMLAVMAQAYFAFKRLVHHWVFNMAEVQAANVEKLLGRLERGTIRGSGDNR